MYCYLCSIGLTGLVGLITLSQYDHVLVKVTIVMGVIVPGGAHSTWR